MSFAHFAIAVGENDHWRAVELVQGADNKNQIQIFTPHDGDGYSWGTTVAPPVGMSSKDFDKSVWRAAANVGNQVADQRYKADGLRNSNNFAWKVINEAGGKVPWAADAATKPRTAPGICGGNADSAAYGVGNQCGN